MNIGIKHIILKIPIPYITLNKKSGRTIEPVKVGDVVITEHNLDVGLVAEVSHGKPIRVYARYNGYEPFHKSKIHCSEYGGADTIAWYKTGINLSLEEWTRISLALKDAQTFHEYWNKRIGDVANA